MTREVDIRITNLQQRLAEYDEQQGTSTTLTMFIRQRYGVSEWQWKNALYWLNA